MLRSRSDFTWKKLTHPETQTENQAVAFKRIERFWLLGLDGSRAIHELHQAYAELATLNRSYIPMVLLHILAPDAAFLKQDDQSSRLFLKRFTRVLHQMLEAVCTRQSSLDMVLAPFNFMQASRPDLADAFVGYLLENGGERQGNINTYLLANEWRAYTRKDAEFVASIYNFFVSKGDVLNNIQKRLSAQDLGLAFYRLDFPELVGFASPGARHDKLMRDFSL